MIDAGILEDILWHIHNWFVRSESAVTSCQISEGNLPASVTDSLLDGQWYRIQGSILNDGLHRHPASDLTDETFDGTISSLAIPKQLLAIAQEVTDWQTANGKAVDGPYASESFGGYTYSIKSDTAPNSGSGGLSGWRLAFRDRLNPWRKIS